MSTQTIEVPDAVAEQWRTEAEAETAERRRKLRQEIADLRAEHEARAPALNEAVEEAEERYRQARAAFEKAQAVLRNATAERSRLSNGSGAQIRRRERRLRETAPPVVEETRRWLNERFQELRRMTPESRTERRRTRLGFHDEATHTTRYSIQRRQQWIVDALRDRLPEIALLPDFGEIREACAALREELPEIQMEKVDS